MVMPMNEELVNRGRVTSSTREKYKHDYISSVEWSISKCESFKLLQQSFTTVLMGEAEMGGAEDISPSSSSLLQMDVNPSFKTDSTSQFPTCSDP